MEVAETTELLFFLASLLVLVSLAARPRHHRISQAFSIGLPVDILAAVLSDLPEPLQRIGTIQASPEVELAALIIHTVAMTGFALIVFYTSLRFLHAVFARERMLAKVRIGTGAEEIVPAAAVKDAFQRVRRAGFEPTNP